jgi:hypothetical protein
VGEDDRALGTGKIKTHATRGHIGGVDTNGKTRRSRLAGRGIGRLTGRHGHDLHAHDHEAVIEDAHHQDEKDGKDEGEFYKRLALAPPSHRPDPLQ